MEFFQIKIFVLLYKISKIYKVVQNPTPSCYDVNITVISSPEDGPLKFVRFEFRHVFSFPCI